MIVSSHNLLELQDLIDEVGVIVNGELVASGTVEEVTRRERRFEIIFDSEVTPEIVVELKKLSQVNQVDYDSFQMTVGLDADHEEGLNGALKRKLLNSKTQGFQVKTWVGPSPQEK